ncbi:MAG: bacteriohopanetetrol glucosamine biosynthesis glycosyltransferase HpnI, partial [Acidobacteria bacterium]|nr:bacteriohopanetetrol glucosamine biosynthesis glycosyltransferase HpnI [Acidobacteriota bacterium]
MTWLWGLPALVAGLYYLLAALASRAGRPWTKPRGLPYVSILKPVRGRDPQFYEAIRSHAEQRYPVAFEILFGVADPADPAVAGIERLQREFPQVPIRLIHSTTRAANGKAGVLADLAREARYPVLLVNDSDIAVQPDYLARVAAPLEDPRIGVVTCLYRAAAGAWPARWEAIGIATEFAPSVLVARQLGIAEFALGSTMVFRAADLRRIGGFQALADYLADDYQLGKRITGLGLHVWISDVVVETHLSGATWGEVWRHQLRWARTIRVSRTAGYYGYLVTQASFWSLVALCAGQWQAALFAMAARLAAGILCARRLGDRHAPRYWFLIPPRDLWGFAVWVAGLAGTTV